ncbi:unnamed protein product [Rotaria sp. Silwood1]|nr:unnamed protein product [Rotaria sp. Silwood1]
MKRGKYSKDFLKAFHEYKNGATSSKVTAKYNIPGSTLRNHKSDPTMKIHGGRSTLLTKHQEQYLVELLKNLEVADVRLIKLLVMKLVSEISICSTCYDFGYDPCSLPKAYGRYSRYPNENHQQLKSMIDFEKENDETNRTYTELTLANMHRFVPPYESFEYDFLSSEKQMINRIP